VLVDLGRVNDAMQHLQAVHDEAAAHYNMGYLLNKKGQPQEALQHFTEALKADPSMDSARKWVEYLSRTMAQARLPQHPISLGVRAGGQRVVMPPQDAVLSPESPMPRRLPPTVWKQPASDDPNPPGISYEGSAGPTAPMPPPLSSSLRPLPRVD
jgi:hypothetical protein